MVRYIVPSCPQMLFFAQVLLRGVSRPLACDINRLALPGVQIWDLIVSNELRAGVTYFKQGGRSRFSYRSFTCCDMLNIDSASGREHQA